jgi:methylenetetrahydrofolate dehydrogenase (NADP+) / methenyltetrahydrofolate cyclohydrolase
MMVLLDGKKVAAEVRQEIAEKVEAIKARGGKIPHLAAVLVGEDPASQTYVNHKVKDCESVGFKSSLLLYDTDISEEQLLNKIHDLNNDPDVDGFIVQLPLPSHISVPKVIAAIDPAKDVDGFHPINIGRMAKNLPALIPATPNGILMLLQKYKIETSGKHCVVLGRSDIVGTPMSILMSRRAYPGDCTVTICHSRTVDIQDHTLRADIIISALGIPGFLKGSMVKEGAIVIDVGTTRVVDETKKSGFSLKGDVEFDEVAEKCSYITPVPGGVGPLTRASLLFNTLLAAEKTLYH